MVGPSAKHGQCSLQWVLLSVLYVFTAVAVWTSAFATGGRRDSGGGGAWEIPQPSSKNSSAHSALIDHLLEHHRGAQRTATRSVNFADFGIDTARRPKKGKGVVYIFFDRQTASGCMWKMLAVRECSSSTRPRLHRKPSRATSIVTTHCFVAANLLSCRQRNCARIPARCNRADRTAV